MALTTRADVGEVMATTDKFTIAMEIIHLM